MSFEVCHEGMGVWTRGIGSPSSFPGRPGLRWQLALRRNVSRFWKLLAGNSGYHFFSCSTPSSRSTELQKRRVVSKAPTAIWDPLAGKAAIALLGLAFKPKPRTTCGARPRSWLAARFAKPEGARMCAPFDSIAEEEARRADATARLREHSGLDAVRDADAVVPLVTEWGPNSQPWNWNPGRHGDERGIS